MSGRKQPEILVESSTNMLDFKLCRTALWLAEAEYLWTGARVPLRTIYIELEDGKYRRLLEKDRFLHKATRKGEKDLLGHS